MEEIEINVWLIRVQKKILEENEKSKIVMISSIFLRI